MRLAFFPGFAHRLPVEGVEDPRCEEQEGLFHRPEVAWLGADELGGRLCK